MVLPARAPLYIFFLLAQQHDDASSSTRSTRRCFLDASTSCASFLLLNTLHPPSALAEDEDVPSSDPLYLARPIGISANNDGSKNIDVKTKDDATRPSAPIKFLLPATRVGLYIYQLLSIAEELAQIKKEDGTLSSTSSSSATSSLIERLDNLLVSSPPSFISSTDPTVTRGDPYNNMPPLLGEIAVQKQKQKERKEQLLFITNNNIDVAPQLFEVGELMGERQQWSRLVRAEKAREEASEIRRAFNIYTTNLNFNRTSMLCTINRGEEEIELKCVKMIFLDFWR